MSLIVMLPVVATNTSSSSQKLALYNVSILVVVADTFCSWCVPTLGETGIHNDRRVIESLANIYPLINFWRDVKVSGSKINC